MVGWRILVIVLFATSVQAALPVGLEGGPNVTEWRSAWQSTDLRRRATFSGGESPEYRSRMVRHRTYMIEGVPKTYQGAASPVRRSKKAVIAGAALYTQHCAACHGLKGRGAGNAGVTLKPTPALKTYISRRPWAADEYLLWSVAEGGVEFGSTMPAFREQLTLRQMWQIIAYMRAGFPKTAVGD